VKWFLHLRDPYCLHTRRAKRGLRFVRTPLQSAHDASQVSGRVHYWEPCPYVIGNLVQKTAITPKKYLWWDGMTPCEWSRSSVRKPVLIDCMIDRLQCFVPPGGRTASPLFSRLRGMWRFWVRSRARTWASMRCWRERAGDSAASTGGRWWQVTAIQINIRVLNISRPHTVHITNPILYTLSPHTVHIRDPILDILLYTVHIRNPTLYILRPHTV
jgi:hypothetical protein